MARTKTGIELPANLERGAVEGKLESNVLIIVLVLTANLSKCLICTLQVTSIYQI